MAEVPLDPLLVVEAPAPDTCNIRYCLLANRQNTLEVDSTEVGLYQSGVRRFYKGVRQQDQEQDLSKLVELNELRGT